MRTNDIIVLDPATTDRPIGFNVLQAGHRDRHRVATACGADRQSDRFRVSPGLTASIVQTTDG